MRIIREELCEEWNDYDEVDEIKNNILDEVYYRPGITVHTIAKHANKVSDYLIPFIREICEDKEIHMLRHGPIGHNTRLWIGEKPQLIKKLRRK